MNYSVHINTHHDIRRPHYPNKKDSDMDVSGNNNLGSLGINDFELQDFIDDANFDQFIDLIRGGNEDPAVNFDCDDLMINNSCLDDYNHFGPPITPPGVMFGFIDPIVPDIPTATLFTPSTLPYFDGEMRGGEEDYNDGNDSSGTATTTTTTTTTKRPKTDRSRTLVSERRRRVSMKERLYALRSLVPNITKMDKASIVGDAVLYVQDLQKQAKKLKSEIANLEASLAGGDIEGYEDGSTKNPNKSSGNIHSVSKGIIQIDVSQVEEKGFYVKVACNRGEGVAIALYKALESLTSFNVQSSNLNTISDEIFEITLALKVKECQQEIINLPNLKLWVTGAFLNQGFELPTGFST